MQKTAIGPHGTCIVSYHLCSIERLGLSFHRARIQVENANMNRSVLFALGAASLFGASIPFAKLLTDDLPPVLLAGLLYLGSGLGLTLARLVRDGGFKPSGLPRNEWPWLLGAIMFGGVVGALAL